MKIAVIGVYYDPNLGDAIICDCVADWFRKEYPQAEIDVIDITGKQRFEEQHVFPIRTMFVLQKKLAWEYWLTQKGIKDNIYESKTRKIGAQQDFYETVAAKKYDIAVFAGGQLFMDWLSLDVCKFIECFDKVHTPVYFNACGAGPTYSKKIRQQLSEYLAKGSVKFISSRDDAEEINRRYLQNTKPIIATYDPALWTSETYQIAKKESDIIGLGVMYCEQISLNKLTKFWMRLIKELNARKIPWKMFCNGSLLDYNFGVHVLDKLQLSKEEYMCDYAERPEVLVEQIAGFKGLISFRLHSHIVAASLNIPGVAMVWDNKLRFFYRHIGHEERCKVVQDSSTEIVNALEQAMQEGYDREKILYQKNYAKELLLDVVKKEI